MRNEPCGFRVIPLPFTCKAIKGLKETSRQGTNTRRQTEPYEQWNFQRS